MTLEELLSLLRGAMLNDRTDRVSGSTDYLWTDEQLVMYMNEAQRRFAVQGLVLRDGSTNEVTRVTLVAGQSTYQLHESVIAVISAIDEGNGSTTDMMRVGHSFLNAYRPPTDNWIDPAAFTSTPPSARPLAFSTDEAFGLDDYDGLGRITLRVHPVPSADVDTHLRLRVVRKPIEKLQLSDLQASPEIPEDHHIEMLDYAAYLALRIVDDDAGWVKRAADFKATFEESVTQARKLAMRKLFAPLDWGFGRGGFGWEH